MSRENLNDLLAFLAVATLCAAFLPRDRGFDAGLAVVLVLAFAVTLRARFPIGTGYTAPGDRQYPDGAGVHNTVLRPGLLDLPDPDPTTGKPRKVHQSGTAFALL